LIQKIFQEISQGEITIRESRFLGRIVRECRSSNPIIEVGTLFGRSTLVITANKKTDQKLITVDNYSWNPIGVDPGIHYRITKSILSEAEEHMNIEVFNVDKNDFYTDYSGDPPALIFLDSVHNYAETRKDIIWAKQVEANIICGHDYCEARHPDVVKAVNEFGRPSEICGSIWVL
jgi:hypothetical protein